MQRFHVTSVVLELDQFSGSVRERKEKEKLVTAEFSMSERLGSLPASCVWLLFQIWHRWPLQWFQNLCPSFCIRNKWESVQRNFFSSTCYHEEISQNREHFGLHYVVHSSHYACLALPGSIASSWALSGSWVGKGIVGSSNSSNAAEQDYIGSQESLFSLQATTLGMRKN